MICCMLSSQSHSLRSVSITILFYSILFSLGWKSVGLIYFFVFHHIYSLHFIFELSHYHWCNTVSITGDNGSHIFLPKPSAVTQFPLWLMLAYVSVFLCKFGIQQVQEEMLVSLIQWFLSFHTPTFFSYGPYSPRSHLYNKFFSSSHALTL